MAQETPMLVSIRDLPQTREIELSSAFVREALAGMPMRAALERPEDDPSAGQGRAEIELYADDDANVYARGTLDGWFDVACSRCLGTVRIPLHENLAVTFVPRDKLAQPEQAEAKKDEDDEEGIELAEDDLDVYGYEDEEVNLEPLLREQLVLAVPFAPLCSESCKGLCPRCGADLNQATCACEPPIDPRLSVLKNIKL